MVQEANKMDDALPLFSDIVDSFAEEIQTLLSSKNDLTFFQ